MIEFVCTHSTRVQRYRYPGTKFSTAVPVPGYPDTAVPRNVVLNLVRVRDEAGQEHFGAEFRNQDRERDSTAVVFCWVISQPAANPNCSRT